MRPFRSPLAHALSLAALLFGCGAERRWGEGDPTPLHPDALQGYPTEPAPSEEPALRLAPASSVGAPARSGVYVVKQGTEYPTLASVAPLLHPGDVVEVTGGATYAGGVRFTKDGAEGLPITIRGVSVDGKRPIVSGAVDTIEAAGDHYVFENLELTGATKRCFFHHADDITIRGSFIHDCKNGILGADDDSGSLTVEETELARSGDGTYHHQIYMATDEAKHPGSVFRLQHCFIHDGAGGNNVKSRAERNEILYNWIEGARYHELEMVGPDGADPKLAREDGQVVGNVFSKATNFHAIRIGGDGTGDTSGRYRFVHNTFLLAGGDAAIRVFDSVESLELYGNAFYRAGGAAPVVLRDDEAKWPGGKAVVIGSGNWLGDGGTAPATLKGTKLGGAVDFASLASKDLHPTKDSPLIGLGSWATPTNPSAPLTSLVVAPLFEPPMGKVGVRVPRPKIARPAAGAYELR